MKNLEKNLENNLVLIFRVLCVSPPSLSLFLPQIDLVAVILVSAVAHRARHVPAFDLRVRDPASPKPNVVTFSCADNSERDRWLDGVAAYRRHLQRQLDWASEYQVQ